MKRGSCGLGVLLGTSVAFALSGCSPAGNLAARQFAYVGATQAVRSSVQNSIEGPRGNNVNVGNSERIPVNDPRYGVPVNTQRKLSVQTWKDYNGDGELNPGELLGKIEGPISFNGYNLYVAFRTTFNPRSFTFYSLDSGDNRISCVTGSSSAYWYTSDDDTSDDWIKALYEHGKDHPGEEYTICAQQAGCPEVFKKTIKMEGDPAVELVSASLN